MVPVAVKLFDPRRLEGGALSPAQLLARFLTEAQVLASLDHPCIVAVKTLEQLADGRPYFVMPYLAAHLPYEMGKDLAGPAAAAAPEADRPRRLPLARIAALLKQLAVALAVVHRRGMVHRSVQPTNILLTAREGGSIKLADFSLVKLPDRNLPLSSHWAGNADYCAPEQRDNATAVGPQADVYSFGILAYRMATGRLPDPTLGPATLPESENAALADLVRRAADPDPAARPPHAGALLPLLDAVTAARVTPPTVKVVPVLRRPVPADPSRA